MLPRILGRDRLIMYYASFEIGLPNQIMLDWAWKYNQWVNFTQPRKADKKL